MHHRAKVNKRRGTRFLVCSLAPSGIARTFFHPGSDRSRVRGVTRVSLRFIFQALVSLSRWNPPLTAPLDVAGFCLVACRNSLIDSCNRRYAALYTGVPACEGLGLFLLPVLVSSFLIPGSFVGS